MSSSYSHQWGGFTNRSWVKAAHAYVAYTRGNSKWSYKTLEKVEWIQWVSHHRLKARPYLHSGKNIQNGRKMFIKFTISKKFFLYLLNYTL